MSRDSRVGLAVGVVAVVPPRFPEHVATQVVVYHQPKREDRGGQCHGNHHRPHYFRTVVMQQKQGRRHNKEYHVAAEVPAPPHADLIRIKGNKVMEVQEGGYPTRVVAPPEDGLLIPHEERSIADPGHNLRIEHHRKRESRGDSDVSVQNHSAVRYLPAPLLQVPNAEVRNEKSAQEEKAVNRNLPADDGHEPNLRPGAETGDEILRIIKAVQRRGHHHRVSQDDPNHG
mmetsp:Transcript_9868/g.43002  ORF Transcript_9868/g.43002 Transcript_9868/m.43002 type:complete len:229 (+) Transcript_9868:577-1263(+)